MLLSACKRLISHGLLTSLMPYDVYERHAVVGRLLSGAGEGSCDTVRVLDVGGRSELLERFTPYRVTSVNVDGSDNLAGSGCALPFADSSFTAVVSIDTLEHLPRESRLPFLRECLRVAQRYVIVAAPFGSEAHTTCEIRLNEVYQSVYGEPHVYLSEHVQYGLPGMDDLDQLIRDLGPANYRLLFAGDFLWQCRQFERAIMAHSKGQVFTRLRNLWHHVASLALFRPVRVRERPDASSNRFYLFIGKR